MSLVPSKSTQMFRYMRNLSSLSKCCKRETPATICTPHSHRFISTTCRHHQFINQNKHRSITIANASSQSTTLFANYLQKRSIQTEGDKEIQDFLTKEIEMEEKNPKTKTSIPVLKDFTVSNDGAQVVFTKSHNGEEITVKANINHSVSPEEPLETTDEKTQSEEPPNFVSKPIFEVKINKGGKTTLAMRCSFPQPDDYPEATEGREQEEEAYVDTFEIEDVAIHEGEWGENVYTLGAETMDGTLYDMLMDMLDERGITEEFVDYLVNYSTAHEHEKYVGFLKELKSFVK